METTPTEQVSGQVFLVTVEEMNKLRLALRLGKDQVNDRYKEELKKCDHGLPHQAWLNKLSTDLMHLEDAFDLANRYLTDS